MKIAIMQADSNGGFPIPASKGGAVSTLVENLIEDNSNNKQADLTVVSYYDKEAEELSKKYKNVEFVWVHIPFFIKTLDDFIYWIVKSVFPQKKSVSFKSFFSLLWYIRFGTNFLKNNQFDKLVLENNIPIAIMIKRSHYQGEYYYHFHNVPRINAKCQKVFKKCKGFLCVSQYVADQITGDNSVIGKIPKEKVHVLYNSINTDLFQPVSDAKKIDFFRKKYGLSKKDKVVIFVGRLSEEKGADVVIRAVAQLSDVKLLIVGSYMHNAKGTDAYQNMLYELTKKIRNRVIFTGYVEQSDMPTLYSLADVAALPSMWEEPAGLTMIEALACGTPVITTQSGGIPEYVGNDAIVLKKDKNIVDNLYLSLYQLLQKPKDKENISISSVRFKYSIQNYMKRFTDMIK